MNQNLARMLKQLISSTIFVEKVGGCARGQEMVSLEAEVCFAPAIFAA
jgi:hypothetical protein